MSFAGKMYRLLAGALRFLHIAEKAPVCSIASGKIRSCLLFDGFDAGANTSFVIFDVRFE